MSDFDFVHEHTFSDGSTIWIDQSAGWLKIALCPAGSYPQDADSAIFGGDSARAAWSRALRDNSAA